MNPSREVGLAKVPSLRPAATIPVAIGETANEVWLRAAQWFTSGMSGQQDGRGGETRETLHAVLAIADPQQRWIPSRRPALNPAFAIAEVVWILAGRDDSAMLNFFNPKLPQFAGATEFYHGAYGHRLRRALGLDQLVRAADALFHNPDSRQVVLQIWDAKRDLPDAQGRPANTDVPCNLVSLVKLRSGRLHWTQVLRSNDLVLGVPHNIVQFTYLQEVLAGWLGVPLGQYTHLSDSLHVYQRDFGHVGDVVEVNPEPNEDSVALPREVSVPAWVDLEQRATRMTARDLTRDEFGRVLNAEDAPVPFRNLLSLLCADAARRRHWHELEDQSVELCHNPALLQLWDGWISRVRRKKADLGGEPR